MGVAPSSKAHGVPDIPAEVDLKPVMGLIVILIPLLLYSFSFFKITIQPVLAPTTGPAAPGSDSGDKDKKKPLNLTVAVLETRGFMIKMDAEVAGQANSDINIPKKMFKDPKTGKMKLEYDYPTLYQKLYEIKQKFKEEKTIHISSEPNVRWQVIARVMDTSMFILKKKKFKDLEDFATAEVDKVEKGNELFPKPLFPQVVFVVME